jgi:hypothetical protein
MRDDVGDVVPGAELVARSTSARDWSLGFRCERSVFATCRSPATSGSPFVQSKTTSPCRSEALDVDLLIAKDIRARMADVREEQPNAPARSSSC